MVTIKLKRKEKVTHIIIWVGILIFVHYMDSGFMPNSFKNAISTIETVILSFTIPYYLFALFIFPKYWKKNNLKLSIWIIAIFAYYWTYYLIDVKYIIPILIDQNIFEDISIWGLLMDAIFLFLVNLGFAFTFFINKKQIHDLNYQLDKEKFLMLKDFIFLKNQLNSHTTYNFLNYCYSLIQNKSINGAKSIELFSDMLRYTSSIKSEQKVDLESELTYISNYIELKTLLSSSMHIDFSCTGKPKNHKIIPRILITYIENAIKHGITNNPLEPVIIKLDITKNILKLFVKNRAKKDIKNIRNSGTGIQYVMNLLKLLYSNRFELNIDTNNSIYEVNLKLILN